METLTEKSEFGGLWLLRCLISIVFTQVITTVNVNYKIMNQMQVVDVTDLMQYLILYNLKT